jgi:hypothetical protein
MQKIRLSFIIYDLKKYTTFSSKALSHFFKGNAIGFIHMKGGNGS